MEPIKPRGNGGMGDFVVRKPRPEPQKVVSHEAKPVEPAAQAVKKRVGKRFKKLRLWWLDAWQPILITLSVALVVSTVLGFRIGSLTKGISPAETQYISSVDSGKKLLENPTFMPHKLPTYVLFKLGVNRPGAYRAVSAVLSVTAIVSCFFILRRWYSLRVAILGSWLLLTSAWLLHFARLALPEASFLLLMPLLWAAAWMYNTPKRKLALTVLLGVAVTSFYIPAFCWLVIGAIIWQRAEILAQVKQTKWWFRVLAGLLAVLLISPLLFAGFSDPKQFLLVSGLPDHLPSLSTLFNNAKDVPLNLLVQGPNNPITWLARIPLLDVFSAAMLLLGLYSLRYHLKLIRGKLLLATGAILSLFIVLGGLVTITALLPIAYLLIAGGMAFMLTQWFTIFPRNPIARGLGTTIMSVVVLLVSFYHINHYFIAWPNTPATRNVFTQNLVK